MRDRSVFLKSLWTSKKEEVAGVFRITAVILGLLASTFVIVYSIYYAAKHATLVYSIAVGLLLLAGLVYLLARNFSKVLRLLLHAGFELAGFTLSVLIAWFSWRIAFLGLFLPLLALIFLNLVYLAVERLKQSLFVKLVRIYARIFSFVLVLLVPVMMTISIVRLVHK